MTAGAESFTFRVVTTALADRKLVGCSKSLADFAWKASKEGAFRAVFSTFNVMDHDGDVTLPGAFEVGAKTRIAQWGHNSGDYVIGKGVIGADDGRAWVDAEFNLKTSRGRDTYESVKFNEDLQQWSYQYDVLDHTFALFNGAEARILKRLAVHEVSPVLLGAGIDTRTEFVKAQGMKFDEHIDFGLLTMRDVVERAKAIAELRAVDRKEGRVFSTANFEKLSGARDALRTLVDELDSLLAAASKRPDDGDDTAKAREFLALLREQSRMLGVPVSN